MYNCDFEAMEASLEIAYIHSTLKSRFLLNGNKYSYHIAHHR